MCRYGASATSGWRPSDAVTSRAAVPGCLGGPAAAGTPLPGTQSGQVGRGAHRPSGGGDSGWSPANDGHRELPRAAVLDVSVLQAEAARRLSVEIGAVLVGNHLAAGLGVLE